MPSLVPAGWLASVSFSNEAFSSLGSSLQSGPGALPPGVGFAGAPGAPQRFFLLFCPLQSAFRDLLQSSSLILPERHLCEKGGSMVCAEALLGAPSPAAVAPLT